MKKEITETITRVVDICDICKNKEAECDCDICRRTLCHNCRTFHNFSKWDDYEGTFCKDCWDIGESHRKLENEAQEVYDIAMRNIWLKWIKEATKDLTDC